MSADTVLKARHADSEEVSAVWTIPGPWSAFSSAGLSELADHEGYRAAGDLRCWLPQLDMTVDVLGGSLSASYRGADLEVGLRLPSYRSR
jgi:hypothetical protein